MPNKKILIAIAAAVVLILSIAFKPVRIALLVLLLLIIAALAVDVVVYVNASRSGVEISAKYFGIKVYPRKKKGGEDELPEPENDSFDEEPDDDFDDLDDTSHIPEPKPETVSEPQQTAQETEPEEDYKPDEPEPDGEQWDGEPDDDEPAPKKSKKKKGENPLVAKVKGLRAKYEKYKPYIPMAWKGFRQLCKTIRFYIDDAWVEVGRFDAHEAAIYYGSIQAVISETLKDIAVMFTLKPKNVKRCDVNVKWAENTIDGAVKLRVKVRLLTIIGILICMAVKYLIIKIQTKRAKKALTAENTDISA
ncbi:hypothetical protein SAMN02910447_00978 [Ruminococcus sp. YE71]|uniref:hypothetical protein n=1 Tax=unclassified Ruminococcus TaxID=2608920 RepID=UPI0008919010|nr:MULTISPECIES: hypothetical protein [unclassified Ruminococcus]SDA15709.1 hypothetical protein SAMN02910446_00977 [Ruminococcus sp. YE78]SFW23042.1 hypothetical protein SAMN02910447_00978 [Ruminococcus sp. YE71]